MFRIKNISSKKLERDIVHPKLGLLRLSVNPQEMSELLPDEWLSHFQQNAFDGMQIVPQYEKVKKEASEPEVLVLNSTGPIEVKKNPAIKKSNRVK